MVCGSLWWFAVVCLIVIPGDATNYRIQTERPRLRAFAISVKPCTLFHFFVIHKYYIIRTLTCGKHLMVVFP